MKLEGNAAVITGAGSGIGREIALAMAREGARIAICDVNMAGANETVSEIAKAKGEAIALRMDVTDEKEVNAAIDAAATAAARARLAQS